jgi:hypothetical protein
MKPKKGTRNGAVARKKRMPKWKRTLGEYTAKDLVLITFASIEDGDAGTALVWGGRLTGVPFDIDPNSDSFVIPRATLPFFAEAGIKFTHKPAAPDQL